MSNSPRAFLNTLKQIRVRCRNNKIVCGELKMHDKHFNIIVYTDEKRELFIRGDGIVTISDMAITRKCFRNL